MSRQYAISREQNPSKQTMSVEAPRRTLSTKAAASRSLDLEHVPAYNDAAERKALSTACVVFPPSSPSAASTHSAETASMRSFQSHGRSMSTAAEYVGDSTPGMRSNRFSVTFPINPLPAPREESPQRPSMSPAKEAMPVPSELIAPPTGPTDSNFLSAIATQERRVLELKEEMQRAEAELNKLKRQWAAHEAHKKKNDARKVTKLQSLNTTLAPADWGEDGNGTSAYVRQEMVRRKTLLSGTKTSNRTVFLGSKHARTLSLLSPVHRNGRNSEDVALPPRQDSLHGKQSSESERPQQERPSLLSRTSTTPDMTTEVARKAVTDIDLTNSNVDRDVLIKTGKKMASDFKDGLWTFLEDLRQATVGEEATQNGPPGLRKQTSTQTLRRGKQTASRTSLRQSSPGSMAGTVSTDAKRPNTNLPPRKRQPPAHASRPSSVVETVETPPLIDVGSALLAEAGLTMPQETPPQKRQAHKHCKSPSTAVSASSSIDAWDTWDDSVTVSPIDGHSSSTTSRESGSAALNVPTSPRDTQSSKGGDIKKDPIPWPALSNFGPATLRRTASHLMSEWEKSMTPDPGEEFRGEEHEVLPRKATSSSGKKP